MNSSISKPGTRRQVAVGIFMTLLGLSSMLSAVLGIWSPLGFLNVSPIPTVFGSNDGYEFFTTAVTLEVLADGKVTTRRLSRTGNLNIEGPTATVFGRFSLLLFAPVFVKNSSDVDILRRILCWRNAQPLRDIGVLTASSSLERLKLNYEFREGSPDTLVDNLEVRCP